MQSCCETLLPITGLSRVGTVRAVPLWCVGKKAVVPPATEVQAEGTFRSSSYREFGKYG